MAEETKGQETKNRRNPAAPPGIADRPETWTISDLSAEFGVTPRTLRYYEELGLIAPRRSGEGGQRLYSRRDRARLKLVLRGRRFGFSLKDLKELLDLYDTDPTRKEQVRRTLEIGAERIAEIDEMIRELQLHRRELLDYRERLTAFLEGRAGPEVLDLPLESADDDGPRDVPGEEQPLERG